MTEEQIRNHPTMKGCFYSMQVTANGIEVVDLRKIPKKVFPPRPQTFQPRIDWTDKDEVILSMRREGVPRRPRLTTSSYGHATSFSMAVATTCSSGSSIWNAPWSWTPDSHAGGPSSRTRITSA